MLLHYLSHSIHTNIRDVSRFHHNQTVPKATASFSSKDDDRSGHKPTGWKINQINNQTACEINYVNNELII